jgi:predicted RNase H-like nuclease (RuvC/YqgF family)
MYYEFQAVKEFEAQTLRKLHEATYWNEIYRENIDIYVANIEKLKKENQTLRKENRILTKDNKETFSRLQTIWKKWKKLQYKYHMDDKYAGGWRELDIKDKLAGTHRAPKLKLSDLHKYLYEIFYSQDSNPNGRKLLYYE